MAKLNGEFPLRDQGLSNALAIEPLPRHRWYFVKEAFSPTLVDHAVQTEGLKPGELLLDPFAGSGTVPLTGALSGLHVQGFEVNPFLWFLSSVKLKNAPPAKLRIEAKRILRAIDRPVKSPLESYSTFAEGNRWNRWLFPRSVLRAHEAGKREALESQPSYRGLLKLALISSAMDCCNATRDGKCLRFRAGWENREADVAQFKERFEARVEQLSADIEASPVPTKSANIRKGDARRLVRQAADKFRLCISSPPYLNSFDYSDIYRPELFLGDFVRSPAMLRELRTRTIRSHVQSRWPQPSKQDFGALYAECIKELRSRQNDLWDQRLPSMVQAYFEDMEIVLKGLRERAQDRASIWLVVSTSAYASVEIPVDLILAEIGQRSGWYLRDVGVLRYLRSSSQHVRHVSDVRRKAVPLRESVIILDATIR